MNWTLWPFLIALQFLTRLPIRFKINYTDSLIARSLLYYPLVGAILGSLLAALAWGICQSPASSILNAAVILAFWIFITGALHLDGLADSADAWLGGYGDRDKTLAIMKDPRSGPSAVVVLICVLLIKCVAIEHLLRLYMDSSNYVFLLLLASLPLLARCSAIALILSTPYARESGLGSAFSQDLPKKLLGIVLFTSLLIPFAFLHGLAIAPVAVSVLLFFILRRLMIQRLGGYTGDCAGALIELIEVAALLAIVYSGTLLDIRFF